MYNNTFFIYLHVLNMFFVYLFYTDVDMLLPIHVWLLHLFRAVGARGYWVVYIEDRHPHVIMFVSMKG